MTCEKISKMSSDLSMLTHAHNSNIAFVNTTIVYQFYRNHLKLAELPRRWKYDTIGDQTSV